MIDIDLRARQLRDHRDQRRPIPVPPEGERLADIDLAYAIQDAGDVLLRQELGFRSIGYKIAATNPAAREHLRISEPFYGRIYDGMTSMTPATLAFAADFQRVHEPEIAIRIGQDLDPSRAPFDAAMIIAAADSVLPAIEIIATQFTPWMQAGAPNLVSDNAAFGHWIMGAPVSDWSRLDLLDATVTLTVNGSVAATGKGRNVDGGAFAACAWLANALAGRGQGLKAGDYVTTGSVTPPVAAAAGQAIVADFGELGRVELAMV